jgi:hypothetical protein
LSITVQTVKNVLFKKPIYVLKSHQDDHRVLPNDKWRDHYQKRSLIKLLRK